MRSVHRWVAGGQPPAWWQQPASSSSQSLLHQIVQIFEVMRCETLLQEPPTCRSIWSAFKKRATNSGSQPRRGGAQPPWAAHFSSTPSICVTWVWMRAATAGSVEVVVALIPSGVGFHFLHGSCSWEGHAFASGFKTFYATSTCRFSCCVPRMSCRSSHARRQRNMLTGPCVATGPQVTL